MLTYSWRELAKVAVATQIDDPPVNTLLRIHQHFQVSLQLVVCSLDSPLVLLGLLQLILQTCRQGSITATSVYKPSKLEKASAAILKVLYKKPTKPSKHKMQIKVNIHDMLVDCPIVATLGSALQLPCKGCHRHPSKKLH